MAGTVSDILLKFRAEGESDVGNAFKRITREARQVEKTFKNLSDSGIKKLRTEITVSYTHLTLPTKRIV